MEKLYEILSHKAKNTAAGDKIRLDDRKLVDIDIVQVTEKLAAFYLAQDDYFENDEHKAKRTYWLNQAANHGSKYAKQLLGNAVA